VYNVVLGLVDIMRGTNSYYKLQVLESDKSKKSVFLFFILLPLLASGTAAHCMIGYWHATVCLSVCDAVLWL